MSPWLKQGIYAGLKIMAVFVAVSVFWALVIELSKNMGISPIWTMITIFAVGIFSMTIITEKTKFDAERELQKIRNKED